MDIISDFLAEEDVGFMDDELIIGFGKMCNDVLAELFRAYIESPDGDKSVQDRIRNLIGDVVYRNTFHHDVMNSGVRDIILGIDLETLAFSNESYDVILDAIKYVKENKHKMISVIDPRTRGNYEDLLSLAMDYDRKCLINSYNTKYENLSERIKANKRVFYAPNEKPVSTRLRGVLNRVKDCETAERGIEFLKYCDSVSVTGWRRCEF